MKGKTKRIIKDGVIDEENVIKIFSHFGFRWADIIIKDVFTYKVITVDFKKRPRTIEEMLDEKNWERKSEKDFPIGNLEVELQARAS